MGFFGWLEKEKVPSDAYIHREIKESRRREDALRKVVCKQARDIAKLQHDVKALFSTSSSDLFKPPSGDKRSIWEYVFGNHYGRD
jgi:hypothetical protein